MRHMLFPLLIYFAVGDFALIAGICAQRFNLCLCLVSCSLFQMQPLV